MKKRATINAKKAIEEARGKAEANEIIKKSLTPEIVEIKMIEKWDSKLPQVSGEANPLVQVK